MIKDKWKTIAIIFICISIFEAIIFVGLTSIGTDMLNKETECSIICFNEESDSYYYDFYDEVCSCIKDDEVEKQTIMTYSERG